MHAGGMDARGGRAGTVLGRTEEIERIERVVRSAPQRSARLLLAGVAGIGKTSLLERSEAIARADGRRVLVARPTEVEQRLPFAVLGDLTRGLDTSVLTGRRRVALDVALGLEVDDDASPHPIHLGLALLDLLTAEAASGDGVTVVIDDVQWIDAASREPLAFALRRLPDVGVSVLLAQRVDDVASVPEVLPIGPEEVVRLWPLPALTTEELVRGIVPEELSSHAVRRIVTTAQGNPLYAIEFARVASEVLGEPGRPLAVPASLAAITASRLAGLPAGTRRALALVSMLARPTVDTVTALGVLDDLRAAEVAGVVVLDERSVRFTHPVLASAAFDATTGTDRIALHGLLAEVTDGTEQLVHRAHSTTAADGELADALLTAALRENSRGANHEAADLAALAWALSREADARHWTRAITVGDLLFRAGRSNDAQTLLDVTRQRTDDDTVRAKALLALATIEYSRDPDTEVATGYARACLEIATHIETRIEAHAILARCEYLDFTEGLRHAEAALSLMSEQPSCDPALRASVLTAAANTRFNAGLGVDRDSLDEAIRLERIGEVIGADSAFGTLAALLKYADEIDVSIEMFGRLARDADPASVPYALGHLPQLYVWRGELAMAEEVARQALRVAQDTQQDGLKQTADFNLALIDVVRGRFESAREEARRLSAQGRDTGAPWAERMGESLLGMIAAGSDDLESAVRHFARYDELGEQIRLWEPGYQRMFGDYLESLVALGELARAEEALTRLRERAERVGRVSALSMVARGRALLAASRDDRDTALAQARHAVDILAPTSLRYELARAQLVLGSVARWAQERSLARDTLSEAVLAFEAMGAELFASRARRERDRISGRSRPTSRPDELTAAERSVAALAASGLTTRQIASSMHVSTKTVESHLTSIFRKTGVKNRAQLAARWANQDPV